MNLSFPQPFGARRRAALPAALALLVGALVLAPAPSAQARMLKLDRLEETRVARMSADAHLQYQQALASIDHILYDRAYSQLKETLRLDPTNDHLRFMVIQMAVYLGDTRWGSDSIAFYDTAIENLREMATSPRLNAREKQRAREALDRVTALQQTVLERDEKRRQWGREIDKAYIREMYGSEQQGENGQGGPNGLAAAGQNAIAGSRAMRGVGGATGGPSNFSVQTRGGGPGFNMNAGGGR